MTNNNLAAKAAAANAELNAARHRITALENNEAARAAGIHRVQREIGLAIARELTGDVPALRAWIVEQQAAIATEEAERTTLEGSLQSLILKVGALGMAAAHAERDAGKSELNEAITQWLALTTVEPVVQAAERVRKAFAAVGKACPLQLNPVHVAHAL